MNRTLIKKYSNLESIDIEVKEKTIKFKDQEYKEREWFNKINSFKKITETEVLLQNNEIKELPSTIYKFFCQNVRKTSFLGLIFPQILFLLISLISFSVGVFLQYRANYEILGKMSIYLGIIFLLIVLVLFIKTLLGEKVYQRKVRGQARYHHISKNEYERIINCFEKLIEEEHYYIKTLEEIIDGDKITLREFRINDIDNLYKIFKNPNVFKYLPTYEFTNIEESKNYIYKTIQDYKNRGRYKLALLVNDELIGYIGLSGQDLSKTTCQIIYGIGEEYWHHSYVYKGLKIFIPFLIENGIETIYCGHVKENVNSGRVMQKAGFERCEERDCKMMIHNEEKDIVSYILNITKE